MGVLINILFPEVDVFCGSDCVGSSGECPVDLYLNRFAASRATDESRGDITDWCGQRGRVAKSNIYDIIQMGVVRV